MRVGKISRNQHIRKKNYGFVSTVLRYFFLNQEINFGPNS